ncbi:MULTISPECIES: M23 family metallopeptidase [Corynebacterium]|uniref:M23 family metallopeptidase n=1 Tax=Corynebacterium pseudogenitalium TaxID=38303 RepID=A0ABD4TQP7_9CORY|nr:MULTISPECIES: M23 family metallopeptidase [Corynebacterium]MCQ4613569.1 M23 family metallopeptidase [Corynebacterium pseudogenitalium]WPJ92542.1 M23 family metallopeptidase [Corynebacterium sp. UMB2355A]
MLHSTKSAGKHRKQSPNKGRVAMVAVATGAVSTAGLSGAAAAALQGDSSQQAGSYTLAADTDQLTALTDEAAPQILAIAEYKPVENLADQLVKAVAHSEEVARADEAARAPLVVKPAEGVFTSGFGPRWGSFHSGVDIANVNGTPILAVMDGTVIDSGPAQGYGNWIRIRHEDGSVSVYGHMDSLYASVGQVVHAGELIAGMGSQGFSTGSHLHFEIHPDGNTPVDPATWLAERGIQL